MAHAMCLTEADTSIAEICRQFDVAQATFFCWKKRYAWMGVAELPHLKQLVADLSLDKAMLQEVLQEESLSPRQQRGLVVDADHVVNTPGSPGQMGLETDPQTEGGPGDEDTS